MRYRDFGLSGWRRIGLSGCHAGKTHTLPQCDRAHLPLAEVIERLAQFLLRVHHEGSIAGDWLTDGFTGDKQQLERLGRKVRNCDLIAVLGDGLCMRCTGGELQMQVKYRVRVSMAARTPSHSPAITVTSTVPP